MEGIRFRVAQRNDYREIAEWLVGVSQLPEHHCLHTWWGQSAEGLEQELVSYWDDSELCYVIALRDDRLVGAMGSEYDEDLKRAWLHGPHVSAAEWGSTARELYARLLAELPAGIEQLDAYLNLENKRGCTFYAEQGFEQRRHLSYEFWLTPDRRVTSGVKGCVPLGEEHEASFKQLYAALFPGAYYSAERITHMIGKSHHVLVLADGKAVLGFAVISVDERRSTGEIQFLGVREESRRKGYGERLLTSAVDWLLDRAGVSGISLNVSEDLVHARRLYEGAGFKLRFTGIGFRRMLPG